MMAPKTFFSSQSVRMVFRVEGGRLRVCFGRMPHPEESAMRYNQQSGSSSAIVNSIQSGQPISAQTSSSSGSNYYTGSEYGVCKDVAPGQQIDFVVDTPCYHRSIADCRPFYFDIKELGYGDSDINYMCRDEGCKRLDQAKFTMTHTGVACSSGPKSMQINWLVASLSALLSSLMLFASSGSLSLPFTKSAPFCLSQVGSTWLLVIVLLFGGFFGLSKAQQAGVYDFGQGRYGERRDDFTPSQIFGIMLICMTIVAGLAFACALCYYISKRNEQRSQRIPQQEDGR